jgi:hypothetical protein
MSKPGVDDRFNELVLRRCSPAPSAPEKSILRRPAMHPPAPRRARQVRRKLCAVSNQSGRTTAGTLDRLSGTAARCTSKAPRRERARICEPARSLRRAASRWSQRGQTPRRRGNRQLGRAARYPGAGRAVDPRRAALYSGQAPDPQTGATHWRPRRATAAACAVGRRGHGLDVHRPPTPVTASSTQLAPASRRWAHRDIGLQREPIGACSSSTTRQIGCCSAGKLAPGHRRAAPSAATPSMPTAQASGHPGAAGRQTRLGSPFSPTASLDREQCLT